MMDRAMMFLFVLAFCALLSGGAQASVEVPPWARGGSFERAEMLSGSKKAVEAEYQFFDQPVDHWGSTTRTFPQRWVENRPQSADPPSVVFLYISGEGEMRPTAASSGYVAELAGELGAAVVSLEHRFYGASQATPNLSVSNLQFLTVEQALADLNTFRNYYNDHLGGDTAGRKFIIVGGSYSGALSCWFRESYPSATVGGWSSSGVVNAILQYVQFDEQIRRSAGEECASLIRGTTAALESAISAGKPVRELYGAPATLSEPDFFYATADATAMAIQYGQKTKLCAALKAGSDAGEDPVQTLANITKSIWGESFYSGCFYDTQCLKNTTFISDSEMSRQWRWQKCSELAYLQIAPKSDSMRSTVLNFDVLMAQCHAVFGDSISPATARTNLHYGGAMPNCTNTVFVDASDDPWQTASVNKQLSQSQPYVYIQGDDLGHCVDLHGSKATDPPQLTAARMTIKQHIQSFLA